MFKIFKQSVGTNAIIFTLSTLSTITMFLVLIVLLLKDGSIFLKFVLVFDGEDKVVGDGSGSTK
jgi:hypothetical protein